MMLDGISNAIYGTKKIVKAVLYWVLVKSKSSDMPNITAFAMLVRSKKASR